jgi:ATP-dependent DNA ligase
VRCFSLCERGRDPGEQASLVTIEPAALRLELDHGWEGVVAKRLDASYRPASRDGAWRKAKHLHARDLQVDRSGWSPRRRVSAVV